MIATPHCLGVADGVGGWNSVGVDAGKYSRELLDRVRKRVNALEATVGTPWSASWPAGGLCVDPLGIRTLSLGEDFFPITLIVL